MKIENISIDELKIPSYKSTYILRPDLLVLSASLVDFGFIQPIVVHKGTMEIIDGNERFLLASSVKKIMEKCEGYIPCVLIDCDKYDAMLMHIRLNRGRGSLVAKQTSAVIRKLVYSGKSDRKSLDRELCMKKMEFDLMMDNTIIKQRKITEHKYSRAWVPVEAPAGTIENGSAPIEAPPNADR
jgi:ParB-like chromosome segregation protein Spo0J